MSDNQTPGLPPLLEGEFLPSINRWMTLGGLLLLATVGGVVGMASLLRYNVTVQAPATVRPVADVNLVQATSPATVRQVLVRENQVVQAGDIIAELAGSERSQIRSLQTRQQQLQHYIHQYETQLAALDAQLQATDAKILTASGLLTTAASPGPVSPPAEPSIEAALQAVLRSDPQMARTWAQQRDRVLSQRSRVAAQIRYDQNQLQTLALELGKRVIQAPSEGTIVKLGLHSPGQTLQPGMVIAQIVPRNGPLVVRARLAAQDISQVEIGQPAQLRITAYPYPDYGTLAGTVQAIAPDVTTVVDATTGMSQAFYEITIQPSQPYLIRDQRRYPLQPGMEVQADIISRQETALQLLLRQARLWSGV